MARRPQETAFLQRFMNQQKAFTPTIALQQQQQTRASSPRNNAFLNQGMRSPTIAGQRDLVPAMRGGTRPGFFATDFNNVVRSQAAWGDMGRRFFPQLSPFTTPDSNTSPGNTGVVTDSGNSRGLTGANKWSDLINKAAGETGVPWQVIMAIMGLESGGENLAPNQAGAMGLMQVVGSIWQGTANQYGGDLMNPWTNIRTGAEILRMNYDTYGSWEKAAAAYFGAIDANGNITEDADYFGTTGSAYVNIFRSNLDALGYGQPTPGEYSSGGQPATQGAAGAVEAALSMQGKPYVWGGTDPNGFDCSGLVAWAYQGRAPFFGRTAAEQYNGTQRISSQDLRPGDLIFFSIQGGGIDHVGIYLGNGQMLNAPKENDIVRIVPINNDWWNSVTAGYGRVFAQ